MNPQTPPDIPQPQTPGAQPKSVGYCRTCGKVLDESTVRTAHGTIYCQEHLPPEPPPLGGAAPSTATPFTAPYSAPYSTAPASSSPYTTPRIVNPSVSPAAAFLLGLIPGVGAIYNGQYAKGLVHALILGILLTAADANVPGIPEPVAVLAVITFWAYMPFEAFHTARKRREGLAVDEFSGLSNSSVAQGSSAVRVPAAALLLIGFGVVFLLNNLDLLDLRRILRFWPVLMIGLGVYLLWLRMYAGQSSPAASGKGNGPGESS